MTPLHVVMAGLPGVGKSTLAEAYAREIGALWLRVDRIEAALRDSHMMTEDLADGGYRALQAAAGAALEQGIDVVSDSVNPVAVTRDQYRAVSRASAARHVDVVITCSNSEEHRARVEARHATHGDPAVPDWARVAARHFEPFPEAAITLDTSELTVDAAVAALALGISRLG